MNKKGQIESGDNSTNIQGSEDVSVNHTYNYGISYSEAKQIAIDVFKSNFYDLSEIAKSIATTRAEELIHTFLQKLENEAPEAIVKIQEPDVQYAIINAQKHYARSGDAVSLNMLSGLLKERFHMKERSLRAIVLNEAIEVLPKLTTNHLNLICAIFLTKNTCIGNVEKFIKDLSDLLVSLSEKNILSIPLYDHLVFAGIAHKDLMNSAEKNLEYFIQKEHHAELRFKNGYQTDEDKKTIRDIYDINEVSSKAFNGWNNSFLNRYSLTSVGIAIAIVYYNSWKNNNLDLNEWIKD